MKVLITGKGGQLAWELERAAPNAIQILSVGVDQLDIADEGAVTRIVEQYCPEIVINAAAYTAVDKAESEAGLAYAVNERGVINLARSCKCVGAKMLHVSTDFVFPGTQTQPYQVDDEPKPLNVYGASKLAGELALLSILGERSVLVRTAWVYSTHGNNFVKTMLRLMAERSELSVVYDQIGTPTWAKGLAEWLWAIVAMPEVSGVFHWTDAGLASWYDFAVAIQELAIERGILSREIPIKPILTASYPTPAMRPSFSVLDKRSAELATGLYTIHWRKQLSMMLDDYSIEM